LAKMAYPEAQYAHLHLVHRLDDQTSGWLIILNGHHLDRISNGL